MTINTTYEPVQYTGNGVTTSFDFPFPFYDDTDLIVYLDGVLQGSGYSISGGDGDVGSVVFSVAPASSVVVTIELSIPYTQADDYVENQAFPAETLERGFDRAAVRDQQLAASLALTLKFPTTVSGITNAILPTPQDEFLLAWDGITGAIQNIALDSVSAIGINVLYTGLATNDFLVYNGTNWVNKTPTQVRTLIGAQASGNYYTVGGTDVAVADGGTGLSVALQGYISGLTMSTAGSSATMSIATGVATDSANAAYMYLSSAVSKTTSAWAVGSGNGGLDTGTITNSTWYHFYVIRRPDTGVVDVVFSTNASSPTLPTNYTQYRRIGSGLTNGSAQWVKFIQYGNKFLWDTSSLDIDVTNPGSSAVTRTLTVPTGIVVTAIGEAFIINSASSDSLLMSPLNITDSAASNTAWPLCTAASSAAGNVDVGYFECETNTSAQVRSRMRIGTATTNLRIATIGWVDNRGA